jgi:hypothetical protein
MQSHAGYPSRSSLSQIGFKNQIRATPQSRQAPNILMVNRFESLESDEFANKEGKKGANGICENSFPLINAKQLSPAFPNPVGVVAA